MDQQSYWMRQKIVSKMTHIKISYDSEQSHDDNGNYCGNNNKNYVNADENSSRFIEVDCSIDLLKSSFKYRHSNILVEDGIQESPTLCQSTLQN